MAEHFFITTAIDYTNGAPHIGHAYEKVLTDVIARFHMLKGEEVFFLTGVDQHGQKVQQSAEKQGVEPQEFVDGITNQFLALWEKLEVNYGRHAEEGSDREVGWAATTKPEHKACVQKILQRLWDDQDPSTGQSRWIYKKVQDGWYSIRQEQFLTDKERGEDGEFGPEWQPVEHREEENFYFRLLEHKQWLLDFIDARTKAGRPFVLPDFRVAELRNAVEKLEGDLCISRPTSRLKWGIPFPETFGTGFVTFVWFDALVNYISFAPGYDPETAELPAAFRGWWTQQEGTAGVTHIIGKDILIPAHGVYWPIMLKALGFADEDMPTLLVHGFWNMRTKAGGSEKMSKSLGNTIDPSVLAEKYGADAVRYYLVSDIATGRDADFSEDRLIQRYNADLANSLGNLLNRTLSMAGRYSEGKVSTPNHRVEIEERGSEAKIHVVVGELSGVGRTIRANQWGNDGSRRIFAAELSSSSVNIAIEQIQNITTLLNGLIERLAPWKMARENPEDPDLQHLLYHLAETLRIVAILLSPIMPRAAHGIFDQLNWKMADSGRSQRFSLADAEWGGLPDGHVLGQPTPLFPRIEATND